MHLLRLPLRRPIAASRWLVLLGVVVAPAAAAQESLAPAAADPLALEAGPAPASPRLTEPGRPTWVIPALLAGGVLSYSLVDNGLQVWTSPRRNETGLALSSAARRVGEPMVYLPVTGGLVAVGLITGKPAVTRAGARVATAIALAAGTSQAMKYTLGRRRPWHGGDGDEFAPFSANPSMPSAHTASAFALATVLADEIRHPVAQVGLYGLAAAVGWSRVYEGHHWTSDVLIGAAVGITAGKLASGRWSVFGLRAPRVLAGPGGPGLGWSATF